MWLYRDNHLLYMKYVLLIHTFLSIKYNIGYDEKFLHKFSSHNKIKMKILLKTALKAF